MTQRLATVIALVLALFAASPVSAADEVAEGQWFHDFLKTEQAHAITDGEGIVVAVIDTGADATHPDLDQAILPGHDFTSASGGRGTTDVDGHGTSMAGLIAANGRVKGVAPVSKIIPIRTTVVAFGAGSKAALGIGWAVANGADVISISQSTSSDDLLLRQEIQAALDADVVVLAAVGNKPRSVSVGFPAAIPGVVAVASVDRQGNHSDISVTGPEVVIAAPGDDISSTATGGGYTMSSGTSNATAIVAGAVALVRARFPELSATEVVRRLTATATDKGAPGRDHEYGYGVLNLVAALTADLPSATATATTEAPLTETPTDDTRQPFPGGGFPWWLLGVVPVIVAGVVLLVWLGQRRR